MKKRNLFTSILAIMMAAVLTACGGSTENTSNTGNDTAGITSVSAKEKPESDTAIALTSGTDSGP